MVKSPTLDQKKCKTYCPDHIKYIDSLFAFAKPKRRDTKI